MRSRSRVGPIQTNVGARERCWDDSPPVTTWYNTWVSRWTPHEAVIYDMPQRYRPRVNGVPVVQYKPCTHWSWRVNFKTALIQSEWGDGIKCLHDPMRLLSGILDDVQGGSWPNYPDTLDVGKAIASKVRGMFPGVFDGHWDRWQRRKPTLTTRANLSVFLGELLEWKRMFTLLPPRYLSLANWERVATRYANGLHLNYNFGWKPFFNELKRFCGGVADVHERLLKFIVEQDRTLKERARDDEAEDDLVWSHQPFGAAFKLELRIHLRYQHCSGFLYSYAVPFYQPEELGWRALADSLGLNLKLSTMWELLPLSFLVEWVAGDIGGSLDHNLWQPDDWVQPFITWQNAMSSLAVRAEIAIVLKKTSSPASEHHVGDMTAKYYQRALGIPHFQLSPGELDADKIRLAASLVGSRF